MKTLVRVFVLVSMLFVPIPSFCEESDGDLVGEEAVIPKAIRLRMQKLEEATKIKFDRVPTIEFGQLIYMGGQQKDGRYDPDTETIFFSPHVWEDVVKGLNKPEEKVTPEEVATDATFQRAADHELGHALMDQISRRIGNGPWISQKQFDEFSPSENAGANILSEGVAEWFQAIFNPRQERLTEESFPSNYRENRFYAYEMVVYSGGHWLVRDIMDRYGERGLIWLISNPPSLDATDMRANAVVYREHALTELKKLSSPTP